MSKGITNEEIVKRFIDSKAIDFKAIGNFVTEFGPQLATSDLDYYGVLTGRHCVIACFGNRGPEFLNAARAVDNLGKSGLGAAVRE